MHAAGREGHWFSGGQVQAVDLNHSANTIVVGLDGVNGDVPSDRRRDCNQLITLIAREREIGRSRTGGEDARAGPIVRYRYIGRCEERPEG